MVRGFDSDEVSRGTHQLRFTEWVDCPVCDTVFDAVFVEDSISVEDIVDPPCGPQVCPCCGHTWVCQMTGWMFYGEAG